MNLRDAISDYARNRDHPTRFPGERRTTDGRFSGLDGRLVHVGRDGRLRDYSAPLTGSTGLSTARLGVRIDDDVVWLADADAVEQRYHDATALVETTYRLAAAQDTTDHPDGDGTTIRCLDLTVEHDHVTHVDVTGPADALVIYCAFRPDGTEARVGKLRHQDPDVVEAFHRREHDFLAASTDFEHVEGVPLRDAGSILASPGERDPLRTDHDDDESSRLGGDVLAVSPLRGGETTLVTGVREAVDDRTATARTIHNRALSYDPPALRSVGDRQALDVPESAAADLRVLELLAGESGARIAGPDFDPLYEHSGGYGYTWFRDDAEISRYLLDADETRDLGLTDWHHRSARFYVDTQLADGSWPHRVWPVDGSLAPGWANARIEGGGDDYQADQTASVVAFLADYHRSQATDDDAEAASPDTSAVVSAIEDGVDALDDSLAADGLPEPCQNAWEDMTGRFAHTAATYLTAYASVARTDLDVASHAATQATAVRDGIDALWCPDRGTYALRLDDGDRDDRLDASTFALVDALHTADAAGLTITDHLDRLASHTATTLDGLYRETDAVTGLVRYEGDDWRQRSQHEPKIWTVATAWGALAAAELATLLDDPTDWADEAQSEHDAADFGEWADALLAELDGDGTLSVAGDYLPEQVFDDGTPDSATPLGWPHAIRLATTTKRRIADQQVAVPEDD